MDRSIKTLFVCAANACRSQMAEAILNHVGKDRFRVYSAGVFAAGYIHPLAHHGLAAIDLTIGPEQRSKSWHEFTEKPLDLFILLDPALAQAPKPAFRGDPVSAVWPVLDPVGVPGDEEDQRAHAVRIANRLLHMIQRLVQRYEAQPDRPSADSIERIADEME